MAAPLLMGLLSALTGGLRQGQALAAEDRRIAREDAIYYRNLVAERDKLKEERLYQAGVAADEQERENREKEALLKRLNFAKIDSDARANATVRGLNRQLGIGDRDVDPVTGLPRPGYTMNKDMNPLGVIYTLQPSQIDPATNAFTPATYKKVELLGKPPKVITALDVVEKTTGQAVEKGGTGFLVANKGTEIPRDNLGNYDFNSRNVLYIPKNSTELENIGLASRYIEDGLKAENLNSTDLDKVIDFLGTNLLAEIEKTKKEGKGDLKGTYFRPVTSFLSIDLFPNLYKNQKFLKEIVLPSLSTAGQSELMRELNIPTNNPVEVDAEGGVTISTDPFNGLSWAKNDEGDFNADFVKVMSEGAANSDLSQERLYKILNGLSENQARKFFNTMKQTQAFIKTEGNAPVSYDMQGMPTFNPNALLGTQLGDDIRKALSPFKTNPKLLISMTQAFFGEDAVEGFAGRTAGQDPSGLITKALNVKPGSIGQMITATDAIIKDADSLITLVEEYDAKGGLSGQLKTTFEGFKAQSLEILNSFTSTFSGREMNDNLRANIELIESTKAELANDEVNVEKLVQALQTSLLYNVASMLQGGDFRNISDYDVRLAQGRIGSLTNMFNDPESSLAVLRQLKAEAEFRKTINETYRGNNYEKTAAAMLVNQIFAPISNVDAFVGSIEGKENIGTLTTEQERAIQQQISSKDSKVPVPLAVSDAQILKKAEEEARKKAEEEAIKKAEEALQQISSSDQLPVVEFGGIKSLTDEDNMTISQVVQSIKDSEEEGNDKAKQAMLAQERLVIRNGEAFVNLQQGLVRFSDIVNALQTEKRSPF